MAFNVCDAPAKSDLAIKNPAGGLHGHEEHIRETAGYWLGVIETAEQEIDLPRHKLGLSLGREFSDTQWLLHEGVITGDARALRYLEINRERDRRRMLGALAVSDLSRALLGEGGVAENMIDGIGAQHTNTIFDVSGINGHPLPPRIHLLQEDVATLLGEGETGTWHRDDSTGLFVHRTEFSLSSPAAKSLEASGLAVAQEPMQTLFPYVPSKSAA